MFFLKKFHLKNNLHIIQHNANIILTPNVPEFNRLLELSRKQGIVDDSVDSPTLLSAGLGCTILLKGNPDIISNAKLTVKCEEIGMPRRCGGQGDILAGLTVNS
jgi:ATP-dependent NAD(P)H-hydrate dehydratase